MFISSQSKIGKTDRTQKRFGVLATVLAFFSAFLSYGVMVQEVPLGIVPRALALVTLVNFRCRCTVDVISPLAEG